MGFSYQTAGEFYGCFLKHYLKTEDASKLSEVTEKASLLCYIRIIHKIHKQGELSAKDREMLGHYTAKIEALVEKLDTLNY